jgi:hypothetical protein
MLLPDAQRYRHARLGNASPPSDPRNSELVRLLLALIDATASKGNLDAGQPQVETAILREIALAEGRLSPAARLIPPGADPRLLQLFTLPQGEGINQIFEMAMLTLQEWRAMDLLLQGHDRRGIAREMTAVRFRKDRAQWLPDKTISQYLWRARIKLRGLVGVAA